MNIFCIPYGRAGVELKLLWEAGNLPEIENHTEVPHGVFSDKKGHPSYIGVALGELLFLNALYDVDLEQYDHDTGYDADLTSIAVEIMERHDHRYDSR